MIQPEVNDISIMRKVTLAKNITPNTATGISPLLGMVGRCDLLSPLETSANIPSVGESADHQSQCIVNLRVHWEELAELSGFMAMEDADKAIETSKTRILRASSQNLFPPGDLVDVYSPGTQQWSGGYRILAMYHSHGLIEKGQQLRRHPLRWIRLQRNPLLVVAPEANSNENPGNDEMSSSSTDAQHRSIQAAVHTSEDESVTNDSAMEAMSAAMPNAWLTQFPSICHVCQSMESILVASECVDEVLNEENAWLVCQQKMLNPLENNFPAITLAMGNEMLSFTNPSRIDPKYFLRIPQAVDAVGKRCQAWSQTTDMEPRRYAASTSHSQNFGILEGYILPQ